MNQSVKKGSFFNIITFAIVLFLFLPRAAEALSIMYPGEGIKTVVSATGEQIKKAVDADNEVSRVAKAALNVIDPNTWAGHFDKFNLDLTVSAYNNTVYGNKTRSFLDRGNHHQEQYDIGGMKKYAMMGGGEFEFKTSVRATDDPQVDSQKQWRTQGAYGTFKKADDYELRLGNVSGSFSSYSLSSSANVGAQLTKELGGKNPFKELQIYLARPNRHLESTSFERQVYGMRMSGLKMESWDALQKLGMSYVKTRDVVDSIKDTTARPANAVENNVVSVDGSFKFSDDVTVSGEWAYSKNDPNTQSNLADITHGQAYKLNGAYKAGARLGLDATSFTTAYEEVDPDFRSASGGGSPDARRLTGGLTTGMKLYGNLPDVQMSYNYSGNRNNLEGQLARRTTSQVHGLNVSFKPFQKSREATGNGQQATAGAEVWNNVKKNMNIATSFGENLTQASDNSAKSQINNQSYQMSTSSGPHTLSTFYKYQITQEKTAATGDRRNASQGMTYGYKGLEWTMPLYPQTPFKTDWTFNATQTRDKSIDVAGRSHQRQYGVSTQTAVNEAERLDVDYNLGLTDNYNVNSDIRTTNLKCAYVVQKFIQEDGNLTVSYTSNKTEEEVSTQNYREAVWRADASLKWGGPAPEVVAMREAGENAVKDILNTYADEDIFAFMKKVSLQFKGNRNEFENNTRAIYARVDDIKYEGVYATSFVPGDNTLEVTFRWQRRWRVQATGAEETAQGTALFRLEKSGDQWLLQEVRQDNPLF